MISTVSADAVSGKMDYVLSPNEVEMQEEIAEGVTAKVFIGVCKGIPCAVKEFKHSPSSMSGKTRINLERELTILKSIHHPNLVEFVGAAGHDESRKLLLVFGLCWGDTLFDLAHNLDSWKLAVSQKWKIATDVSCGMEYLHGLHPPVIHRDLKSLNLLLEDEVLNEKDVPQVKISDFGLARIMDSSGGLCMTKCAGTCQWMAPEVFTSNSYDRSVDVYSYGIILYETICQKIPFDEDEDQNRLGVKVVAGYRPDLEDVPDDCPQILRSMMVSCWAQAPGERPDFNTINRKLSAYQSL